MSPPEPKHIIWGISEGFVNSSAQHPHRSPSVTTAGCTADALAARPGVKHHFRFRWSSRPRRPLRRRWISRRSPHVARDTFIRLESFGSSQPSVKAYLRAAGCFLTKNYSLGSRFSSRHRAALTEGLLLFVQVNIWCSRQEVDIKNTASHISVACWDRSFWLHSLF